MPATITGSSIVSGNRSSSGFDAIDSPINLVSGRHLIVLYAIYSGGGAPVEPTISLNSGTASIGTNVKASVLIDGNAFRIGVIAAPITGTGTAEVLLTSTGLVSETWGFFQAEGLDAANPIADLTPAAAPGQTDSWYQDTSGSTYSTGAGTTSAAGLLVSVGVGDDSSPTYSSNSDTLLWSYNDSSVVTSLAQVRSVSAGAQSAMTYASNQSASFGALAVLLKAAAGGTDATVQPTGLSATVSRGTPTIALVSNPTVQPSGFSLAVSRGTPLAGTTQSPTVPPNGLSATALLGTPTVVRAGSPTVNPTGFGLSAILGTDTISIVANPTVQPTGFGLTVSRGTFTTESDVTIQDIPGFGLSTSLGTSSITRSPVAQPTGYSLSTSLGTPTILLTQRLSPSGLSVTGTLGTPSIALEPTMLPSGLSVSIGLGSVSISTNASITQIPQGLPMPAMLGSPTIVVDNNPIIRPVGFGLTADVGGPSVALSPTMLPAGFALLVSRGAVQLGGEIATVHGALTGRLRVSTRLTGHLRLYPAD